MVSLSTMLLLPTEKPRWLARKDKGGHGKNFPTSSQIRNLSWGKTHNYFGNKIRRLGGGWKEAGQDGTSSYVKTRRSSSVSCLMLVVFGSGAAPEEGISAPEEQRARTLKC